MHPAGQSAPSFSSRLELPISWDILDAAPSSQILETAEQTNASLLAFLLQEIEVEARPRPTDEQLIEALAPLTAKLDVIIELVTRLSYRDLARPPRSVIELDERHIAWQAADAPQPGSWLRIKIYFHPTFLEPIVVFGQVEDDAEAAAGSTRQVEARLAELSERIAEDLHRLAFLTQRRQRLQNVA